MKAVDYINDNFIVDKKLLKENLEGKPNIFIFYQSNLTDNANYPVFTSLLLLNVASNILKDTGGEAYLFYQEPDIIAKVYADEKYSSEIGKNAYYNQINYLKKIAPETFGFALNVRSIQDYVINEPKIQELYSQLKEDKPFKENVIYWLSLFSKPARIGLLASVFGSRLFAKKAETVVFLDQSAEKREGYEQKINSKWKEIIENPRFEKYSIYELLTTIGPAFTNNAFFRPNQGANKAMQDEAKIIAEKYAESIFGKKGTYVPVEGLRNLNVPFSFVHPRKVEAGVDIKFARINEIVDLEKIIQVDGIGKEEYLLALDKQFPQWRNTIKSAQQYNRENLIENVEPSFEAQEIDANLEVVSSDSDLDSNISYLTQERDRLRRERKFKEADAIRDQLIDLGYYPKDKPVGKAQIT